MILPIESVKDNQENEKLSDNDARKKITINMSEPTTPKTLERLLNIKAPTKPPDDD